MNSLQLIAARRKLKLSPREMASALKIPYTTYSQLERGNLGKKIRGIYEVAVSGLLLRKLLLEGRFQEARESLSPKNINQLNKTPKIFLDFQPPILRRKNK